jgi:magnesium transporter
MITIYRSTSGGLKVIEEYESGCWVNVVNPTNLEIEELLSQFGFPADFLTDPLDVDERARTEKEDASTLILLRVPRRDIDSDIPFVTLPIGIILTHDLIITISLTDADVIQDFINDRVRGFSTDKRNRFVLLLFMRTALLFLNYLKEINRMTNAVQQKLHRALKNEELIKLLNLEKSLVFFITSLRSNALMMEKCYNSECMKLIPEEKDLFDEVIIENRQAIEMANIYSDILSGMMDAFASVISNNLNMVMKLLTTVTILIMLPTLVVSFYGMNVDLPYQTVPHAFLIPIGISALLSLCGIVIFWKGKFF